MCGIKREDRVSDMGRVLKNFSELCSKKYFGFLCISSEYVIRNENTKQRNFSNYKVFKDINLTL